MTQPHPTDQDLARATGCLYGVALGDAMGMPSELWPRKRVQRHFGRITGFLPGPDGHFVVDGFAAGQVTDDTQQAVMLAEAILDGGGQVIPDVVARHLVAWADRTAAVASGSFLGPSSSRAIDALRRGAPVSETGARGDTNGAAMRIAPVGVLCPSDDLEALVDAVEAACLASHNTDIAIAGAAMIAAAVSTAIDDDAATPAERVDHAITTALAAAAVGMRRGGEAPGASLVRRTELGLRLAREVADDDAFGDDLYDLVGAGVATTESVPAALALAVRAGGDPLRGALLAANLGGDCDTVGAMTGAVCGAATGVDGIDPALLDVLRRINDLHLEPLAAALVTHRRARARQRAAS